MRWMVVQVWLLVELALLSGCNATTSTAMVPTATIETRMNQQATVSSVATSQSKLSERLQQLSDPALNSKDAQAQAVALGLPASGSGSLNRDAQGGVLITVRMTDTSEASRTAVQAAGATIVNVAEAYHTLTAYVRPEQLTSLAALPVVKGIQEELRP